MYDIWCARNQTANVTEQRLMDQRRLIVKIHKLTTLEMEDIRQTVDGQTPGMDVEEEEEEPELTYRE